MVSVNLQNNVQVANLSGSKNIQATQVQVQGNSVNPVSSTTVTNPGFKAHAYTTATKIRTNLVTSDEKKKYNEIVAELDAKYRRKLEYALKTGILLKNDSDDRSSVLDNLHKILKEERDHGLTQRAGAEIWRVGDTANGTYRARE